MHRARQETKNDQQKQENKTEKGEVHEGEREGYADLQQAVNPVLAHMHQGFQTPICIKFRHLLTLLCAPSKPYLSLNTFCKKTCPFQTPALCQQPCNLKTVRSSTSAGLHATCVYCFRRQQCLQLWWTLSSKCTGIRHSMDVLTH